MIILKSASYILSDVVVNPHPPAWVQLRYAGCQRLKKFCIPSKKEYFDNDFI